jgi:hypothetical protein
MRIVRLALLAVSGMLPGCETAVLGRTFGDAAFSAATGKDCSLVYLEQGRRYCRALEPPPAHAPFCTRSIGTVDCWTNPEALTDRPREIADGPHTLTPEQEQNRTRRWPDL